MTLVLAGALIGGLLAFPPLAAPAGAADPGASDSVCADPVLPHPRQASDVVADLSAKTQRRVAGLNDMTAGALRDIAGDGPTGDDTLWLDRCGHGFFLDPVAPGTEHDDENGLLSQAFPLRSSAAALTPPAAAADPTTGPAGPLADTFSLASDPSATRTIYLDFDGQTISGSAWNDSSYGASVTRGITAPPYSADGTVDTRFTAAELTEIQRAWLTVAEDYAPYNVNVTTQDPGVGGLQRTSAADSRYGIRVVITAHGPIYDYCKCGGIAYVGVFGDASANAYQPAWVFTDGTSTDGVILAQAISHEVGHTLGLHHDGVTTTPGDNYYTGAGVWAPIMGASYYSPLTQWSKGEYPQANNPEDDIAIIGRGLGWKPDDYANTRSGAEALPSDASSQRAGIIGTRSDVDAFTLRTDQATTISVQPTGYQPDLDLSLTVTDTGTGKVVATVDPTATKGASVGADGLGATYQLTPTATTTYLLSIDGVGHGDPSTAGRYSDYGSQGAYLLTVVPGNSRPLGVRAPTASIRGRVGQRWEAVGGTTLGASGGLPPYSWSATGLPPGASLDRLSGAVSGPITRVGSWKGAVTVTDATGAWATTVVTFTGTAMATTATSQAQTPYGLVPLRWQKVTVKRAKVGRTYRGVLTVTGGSGALRWAVSGALPPGIRLKVRNEGRKLVLAGKSRKPGRWRMTLHGKDRAGRVLSRSVRLAVKR
jgi:hypothetical protein